MLNPDTILFADTEGQPIPDNSIFRNAITRQLRDHGYCLLRGYDTSLDDFSSLIGNMCSTVTFDPARKSSTESVQKVDAGIDEIGLHIENGNTPHVPQLLGFYCQSAARHGSQTTLCDGARVLEALDSDVSEKIVTPFTVTRTLPEPLWKAYLAQEHPALNGAEEVRVHHLDEMLGAIPGQSATLNEDGSLTYSVDLHTVRTSVLCGRESFANALLGPSFSYEPPRYTLHNGQPWSESLRATLQDAAEQETLEIPWQDGDIALIDNWRVMHGRRRITDSANRQLFIGMGDL